MGRVTAIQVRPPTPTASKAIERHRAFHDSIAEKAAALAAAKASRGNAIHVSPAPVRSRAPVAAAAIAPEAMPAETDPPTRRHWFHIVDVGAEKRAHPSIAEIQDAVARHYRIRRDDICSARRTKDVVMPRMIAAYLCKILTPLSLPTIGRKFGGRDHTTILHAVRKLTRLVHDDAAVAKDVSFLIQSITGTARPPA